MIRDIYHERGGMWKIFKQQERSVHSVGCLEITSHKQINPCEMQI